MRYYSLEVNTCNQYVLYQTLANLENYLPGNSDRQLFCSR
ncbi:hypothetical protein H1P_1300017 [Hyella patelloides LEGE 07179]|uniref:Uncharacterized protein n=1 Tax=Hyella patelloides LEGE 07179 TaxID=945734 RepID=A0A563VL35_9CYAN|nr:hypothetical protein H1P_1300017 [Hyella patelloides LEGE 07179]